MRAESGVDGGAPKMGAMCTSVAKLIKDINRQRTPFEYQEYVPGRNSDSQEKFEQMELTNNDLQQLFNAFNDCSEESNYITHEQFSNFLAKDVTNIIHRQKLYEMFAAQCEDGIPFDNFVILLWKYCAGDRNTLFELSFELFDIDNTGVLETAEVKAMLEAVYGGQWKNIKHANPTLFKLLMSNDPDKPSVGIDLKHYKAIVKSNLMLISTALAAQRGLQKFGGHQFWERQARLASDIGKGRAASAFEIWKAPPKSRRRQAVQHTPIEAFGTTKDRYVPTRSCRNALSSACFEGWELEHLLCCQ